MLSGCGAPDYGGHDSDANSWPKSDKTSTSKPSTGSKPKGRTRSPSPSARSEAERELRIPPTLAGELLNLHIRIYEPVPKRISGLTEVSGGYGTDARPMYGVTASTGTRQALRELDRWYVKDNTSIGKVGRATCARFVEPLPAAGCWRSDGSLTVAVSGAPDAQFAPLAQVLAEAWTYVRRHW